MSGGGCDKAPRKARGRHRWIDSGGRHRAGIVRVCLWCGAVDGPSDAAAIVQGAVTELTAANAANAAPAADEAAPAASVDPNAIKAPPGYDADRLAAWYRSMRAPAADADAAPAADADAAPAADADAPVFIERRIDGRRYRFWRSGGIDEWIPASAKGRGGWAFPPRNPPARQLALGLPAADPGADPADALPRRRRRP